MVYFPMSNIEQKISDAVDILRIRLDETDDETFDAWNVIVSACDIALWTVREGLADRALRQGYGAFLRDNESDGDCAHLSFNPDCPSCERLRLGE